MAVGAIAAGALRIGSMFARGAGSVLSGGARGVGRSGGMLRRAVLKKTKVKRENIARSRSFNKKLMERNKRRQKEKTIETFSIKKPKLGSIPGKSFFEKILDFIGTLFLGWLFNNLPKIIKFVQDLIKRINLLIDSLKSFVENVGKWFTGLKNVVVAGYENLKNFDFTDSEGKLKSALAEMDGAFKGMQTDVEGMKNALTADMSGETSGGVTGGGGGAFSTEITDDEKAALSVLAKYESGAAGYDAVNQGGSNDGRTVLGYSGDIKGMSQHGGRSLTDMTIGEIKQLQYDDKSMSMDQWNASGKLHAVGRYQFIGNTLPGVASRAGFGDDVKFTKTVQDKMAIQLIKERGISPWVGPSDKATPSERQSVRKVQTQIGDGSKKKSGNDKGSGYQMAVNVGKFLNKEGYDVWQHPDFNVDTGYTGSGNERVMRRSYNSYHNYGEALDVPIMQRDGNGNVVSSPEKLDELYAYLNNNRSKFNIAELKWKDDANHFDHLHVSFKGGGGSPIGNIQGVPTSNPNIGSSTGPQNTIIIIEEEAPPPMMMGQSGGSSPIIVMGASLNNIMKRKLLTDLAYT